MGHYASEMMCNKCGELRCVCSYASEDDKWLVDSDLTVMKVKDHDKLYAYTTNGRTVTPGNASLRRWKSELFDTKEEAMEHRIVVANDQVEAAFDNANEANKKYRALIDKRDAFLRSIA